MQGKRYNSKRSREADLALDATLPVGRMLEVDAVMVPEADLLRMELLVKLGATVVVEESVLPASPSMSVSPRISGGAGCTLN